MIHYLLTLKLNWYFRKSVEVADPNEPKAIAQASGGSSKPSPSKASPRRTTTPEMLNSAVVERAVEARSEVVDALNSMIRVLTFAETYVVSGMFCP